MIFLFSFVSKGQKCKYDKEEKDAFSGNVKKSIETKLYHDHKIFGEPDGREVLIILPFGSTLLKMERMFFLKHFAQSIEGNFRQ